MWKRKWALRIDEPEAEGSAASDGSSTIWDDLLDDEVAEVAEPEVKEVAVEVAEEVGGEAEPQAPAPAGTEAPTEAVTEEPKVEEQRVVVEAPTPAPVVSQPPPQQTPLPTVEQVAEFRRQAMEAIERQYALPEDEATSLQVEPEKVLPKLAARLHANIYDHVMRSIAQSAPHIVEQTLARQNSAKAAEDAFFGRWQELRPHAAQVQQVAQMWRQMYPQATLEEAVEGIGQATKALLGLGSAAPVAAQTASQPPPVPARPSARGPARPVVRQSLSAEEQAFADLAKEFTEEI